MLLRQFGIDIDLGAHPVARIISFESRCLCNYLARHIRPERVRTEDFGQIVISGAESCREPYLVDGNLVVQVPFLSRRYLVEDKGAGRHEVLIEMLTEGWRRIVDSGYELPMERLTELVESFREGGYVNEWVHQAKVLCGSGGYRGALCCSLDMDRFVLTLELTRRGEVVGRRELLRTKPDEIIYHYEFKDLLFKDGVITVTRRPPLQGALCVVSLKELLSCYTPPEP